MIVKEQLVNAIKELPETATVEDAMERLFFIYKVEHGIEQADSGKTVSHEEAKKRMDKWLK